MLRSISFISSLLVLSWGHVSQAAQPNFVWIISEDNSIHYLKHFFETGTETPNIASLARQGLTFRNAFSNAPVCSVARTTLITGCYAPRIGTQFHRHYQLAAMPDGLQMFPAYLRQAGYYTTNNRKKDYNAIEGEGVWDESSRNASWRGRASSDQPFFHMESHGQSHESSLHFSRQVFEEESTKTDPQSVKLADYHPDTPLFRYTHARYLDRIRRIDAIVGDTVAKLEADGLLDDTFVFYFGDHGGVLPRSKGYVYESGLHVPLVVRVPKNFRHLVDGDLGGDVNGFVSFVDLGPTLLHLAGVSVPEQVDGQPFLGAGLTIDDVNKRQVAFGYADRFDEKYDLVRTIRRGRFQYIRNYQPYLPDGLQNNYRYRNLAYQQWREIYLGGKLNGAQAQFFEARPAEQLFDCVADPHQVNDLSGNPDYAEILSGMRQELTAMLQQLPDLSFFPESHLVEVAMANPVEFGRKNQSLISKLVDVANLATRPFAEVELMLRDRLRDENPWVRYWAIMACTSFGEVAGNLSEGVEKCLQDDHPLIRVRAAEFFGRVGGVDPQETLVDVVNSAQNPVVAVEALNSIVWLRDFFGERFPIDSSVLKPIAKSDGIERRIAYLSGK